MNEAEIDAASGPFHNASLVINIIVSGYRFDHLADSGTHLLRAWGAVRLEDFEVGTHSVKYQ